MNIPNPDEIVTDESDETANLKAMEAAELARQYEYRQRMAGVKNR